MQYKQEQRKKKNQVKLSGLLGSIFGIIGLFAVFLLPIMGVKGDFVIGGVDQTLTFLDVLDETSGDKSIYILAVIGVTCLGFILSTIGFSSPVIRTIGGLLSFAGGGLAYYVIEIAQSTEKLTALGYSLGVIEFNVEIGVYVILVISLCNILLGEIEN